MARMTDAEFDELMNSPPDAEKIARGARIYQQITGEPPFARPGSSPTPRVAWGDNSHHRAFTNLCTGQILYSAGLVPFERLSRDVRDEVGGKPDLVSMMRDYISLSGSTPPPYDDKNAILTRAIGSSDFPSLAHNVLNQSLITGFNDAPESWPRFTKYAPVSDFKTFDVLRGPSIAAPPEVPELGEVGVATLSDDGAESDYIRTHVHRVSLTRQVLLNSDINAMARIPYQAGIAVSRGIGNDAFNLLIDNNALDDGVALFHSSHGNLDASAAEPSVAEVNAAFALMMAQQNGAGEYLNLKPKFIIAGPAYASTLAVIRSAMNDGDDGNSDGTISTVIDSRLTGSTAWFTCADPMHGGILVVVLAGSEGVPRFEQITSGPATMADGLHFKSGYDYRIVCGNYKALTMNAGA